MMAKSLPRIVLMIATSSLATRQPSFGAQLIQLASKAEVKQAEHPIHLYFASEIASKDRATDMLMAAVAKKAGQYDHMTAIMYHQLMDSRIMNRDDTWSTEDRNLLKDAYDGAIKTRTTALFALDGVEHSNPELTAVASEYVALLKEEIGSLCQNAAAILDGLRGQARTDWDDLYKEEQKDDMIEAIFYLKMKGEIMTHWMRHNQSPQWTGFILDNAGKAFGQAMSLSGLLGRFDPLWSGDPLWLGLTLSAAIFQHERGNFDDGSDPYGCEHALHIATDALGRAAGMEHLTEESTTIKKNLEDYASQWTKECPDR